jgi:hypothetical protein
MKILILIPFFISSYSNASVPVAKLKYSVEFVLQKVLELKRKEYNPLIPVPSIHFESQTPLEIFQQAIEGQWGMRPQRFSNAYSVSHNMLFLNDEASYYIRTKRCMDDSLAHELTHFVQARYQGFDLHDESLEWDAIEVQNAFRESYCSE